MSVLSAQTIRRLQLVRPLHEAYNDKMGNSVGLSSCGVDITLAQAVSVAGNGFTLASAQEYFDLPNNVMGVVHDKSSLARKGLAVQNTVLEPGWHGYLTLELTYHFPLAGITIHLAKGAAIAQVVFHFLDVPTELPYKGKYQEQEAGPQEARTATERAA